MLDQKIVNWIARKYDLMEDEFTDNNEYDKIVAMEWRGIPNLKDKPYYVEYIDTTGRDIIQQAVNIYATQKPKWDVLPRGLGDIDTASEFEKIIEWYMDKAAQEGEKRFHSEALIHSCTYNKVCAQIEWTDAYSFCVKIYHPNTIVYEYGNKLNKVAVINNVLADSIVDHWSSYAKAGWEEKPARGDSIGKALKRITELLDDDSEQRMMYVDYTDKDRRYTYCYPTTGTEIDDSFGFDDSGKKKQDVIVIQDKRNELGFINWAIARGEGDPLLAPLYKGKYYDNVNDLETIKATTLFKRAFYPNFIKHGREGAPVNVDFSGEEVILEAPDGTKIDQVVPPPLDSGFNEMSAQMQGKMVNSIGISQTASLQISNVQHATLQDQIKLRLAQLEPYKRVTEQLFVQLAYLMFRWAVKKEKILKGQVLYSSKGKNKDYQVGSELQIDPKQINMDALYIKCEILANNANDRLQLTNQISLLKQSGIPIPSSEFIEQLSMANPDVLREEWEKEQLRDAGLQAMLKQVLSEVDIAVQKEMAAFQAQLQMQMQSAQAQMQQQMAMQQPQGQVPAQQGQPLPSDQNVSGLGADAARGGNAPQNVNSEITQSMR